MAKSSERKFGHADCLRCEADFDLADGMLHTLCTRHGNEEFYFFLCPRCAASLSGKARVQITAAILQCWRTFLRDPSNAHSFAVTTRTTLVQHDGDVVRALEVGSALPKRLHRQILEGKAEIGNLHGMTIICSVAEDNK